MTNCGRRCIFLILHINLFFIPCTCMQGDLNLIVDNYDLYNMQNSRRIFLVRTYNQHVLENRRIDDVAIGICLALLYKKIDSMLPCVCSIIEY